MEKASKIPSQHLTVYLLKDGVTKAKAIAKEKKAALKEKKIELDGTASGTLFLSPTQRSVPRWTKLFERTDLSSFYAASTRAVFLVRAAGRLFALTFGHGRHLLEPGSWEERFGLLVTLNAVDHEKIRSIDTQSFDALALHRREQASKAGEITNFGLDVDQDLLRAVTGEPEDQALGRRMSGKDSLVVAVGVKLETLRKLLARYLKKSLEKTYRTHFSWVDHLSAVSDTKVVAELDGRMLAMLVSPKRDRLWLTTPEIVDWSRISRFRYVGTKKQEDPYEDLFVADFLSEVDDPQALTLEQVRKSRKVEALDDAGHAQLAWSLYKCVYAEIEDGDETFLLSDGKWYRIDTDFVTMVTNAFNRIPLHKGVLPDYSDVSETAYNARVARENSKEFALFDCKCKRVDGNEIEFCDLLRRRQKGKERAIIHVKRYSGSSTLSHLFAQGVVSAEAFLGDVTFRRAVDSEVKKQGHRPLLPRPDASPDPKTFEVVYAIVSKSSKGRPNLPFFSRLNLRNAAQRLRRYGFKVSRAKVAMA